MFIKVKIYVTKSKIIWSPIHKYLIFRIIVLEPKLNLQNIKYLNLLKWLEIKSKNQKINYSLNYYWVSCVSYFNFSANFNFLSLSKLSLS